MSNKFKIQCFKCKNEFAVNARTLARKLPLPLYRGKKIGKRVIERTI